MTQFFKVGSQLGIKTWMVDRAEISRLHPLLNTDKLVGAMYSPQDGTVDPTTVCTAYIKGATKYGAEVEFSYIYNAKAMRFGVYIVNRRIEPVHRLKASVLPAIYGL